MTDDKTIPVMVALDSDDLRRHAVAHAEHGEHGPAHVLLVAAKAIEAGTYGTGIPRASSQRILWGITRPDGTPATRAPSVGSAFWKGVHGNYGFDHERGEEMAENGAQEFGADLVRQGVDVDHAVHHVVRIVITTTIERQLDWPDTPPMQEGLKR